MCRLYLHGSQRPELHPLEQVAAEKDADAGAGDGDAAGEHGRLRLAEVELSLEVLWQENDEAGDDDELHAGAHAGHHVDLVGEQVPCGAGDVLDVLAVVVVLLELWTMIFKLRIFSRRDYPVQRI